MFTLLGIVVEMVNKGMTVWFFTMTMCMDFAAVTMLLLHAHA